MDIEKMHEMLETLVEKAKNEIDLNIECVDTNEMGAVVDMIKDLSEAIYHRTATNAMGNDRRVGFCHAWYDTLDDCIEEMNSGVNDWSSTISMEEKALLKQRLNSIIQRLG